MATKATKGAKNTKSRNPVSATRGKVITPPGASKELPRSFKNPAKGSKKGRDIADD